MKDEVFLHVLNYLHPSISFTMELSTENTLPFLGMVLRKDGQSITTSVYLKPTNTGLLLRYNSHVDNRHKKSSIITLLDRAFKLSSNWSLFHEDHVSASKPYSYSWHIHTCQPPEFQNLETSRNPRVVRMRFTTMSEYSPRITRRLSECSRCVLRQCPNALRESPEGFPNFPDISP